MVLPLRLLSAALFAVIVTAASAAAAGEPHAHAHVAAPAAASLQPAAATLPPACDTFAWDVSRELAALQAPAVEIDAGRGPTTTPIELDTRYDARLHPQDAVTLAARPGKPMLDDAAMAGLLGFRVPEDGRYRVSITTGHWIDVVDGGGIVPSLDFQGRRGCPLVHKIVEFELSAGRPGAAVRRRQRGQLGRGDHPRRRRRGMKPLRGLVLALLAGAGFAGYRIRLPSCRTSSSMAAAACACSRR